MGRRRRLHRTTRATRALEESASKSRDCRGVSHCTLVALYRIHLSWVPASAPMWKSCGRHVQNLWRSCARKFIFGPACPAIDAYPPCGRRLRVALRLIPHMRCVRSTAVPPTRQRPPRHSASTCASAGDFEFQRRHRTVTVHRFQETIGGRAYCIEVTHASNRWRAQLMRAPGVPSAMMPFYGPSPDEAARQLTQWLSLAHRRAPQPTAGTVAT